MTDYFIVEERHVPSGRIVWITYSKHKFNNSIVAFLCKINDWNNGPNYLYKYVPISCAKNILDHNKLSIIVLEDGRLDVTKIMISRGE